MEDAREQSDVREYVREQLKADWRKHPELEWASLDAAFDGDVLVGEHPKFDRTTFCGGELLIDAVITGLRVTGSSVNVSLAGKKYVLSSELAFKQPLFVKSGDKIEVVVRGKAAGEVRFSMHGHEIAQSLIADVKRAVAELLEAS